MPPTVVARLDELTAGAPRLVEVAGARIVLTRIGDAVYACADACAHKGGPLSQRDQERAEDADGCFVHGYLLVLFCVRCTMCCALAPMVGCHQALPPHHAG